MTKFLLTFFLPLLAISAYGQFNRNLRTIDKPDSLGSHESIGTSQKIRPAEFSGGMAAFYKYLYKKMKFPKDARAQKVRGKVFVQFVIDTNGNVKKESVKVTQSLMESCDKEAIRLIMNSPPWIPAMDLETNKTIEVMYSLPISFYTNSDNR